MQQVTIMAFRKRLKKRGYTEISIYRDKETGLYIVKAKEPLANAIVSCEYSIVAMYHAMRF